MPFPWLLGSRRLHNACPQDLDKSLTTFEIGKAGISVMGNGGEYLSAWPSSERWCDPIVASSSSEAALRPGSSTVKYAIDGRARGIRVREGYSAEEAAQDARDGAWLTAWPAGENCEVTSVSVSTL